MITCTLKLRLNASQTTQLDAWLWNLTGVHNWAIRKIELDAKDGIYYSKFDFTNLLNGHSAKLGIPSHVIQGGLANVHQSWTRCFQKKSGKPKLKGNRNRLNSIPFPDPIATPMQNRIKVLGLGALRFHKQQIPEGRIKCSRIVKRASGWYLVLFIDAEPKAIPVVGNGQIGIDPGFHDLLTLSTGYKIDHPRELEARAQRLAQAQRGRNKRLAARIQEDTANRRKDRNHKLSRKIIAENQLIVFSKDSSQAIAKTFGKSVASSSHYQLRSMLAYKCRAGGREYIEVPSRNSTRTCSACGDLTGPTGFAGLKVRQWQCAACGAEHDRDINAAVNTLIVGLGLSHERYREIASESQRLVS